MEYELQAVSNRPAVDLSQTLVSPFLTPTQHTRFLCWCSRAIKALAWCNRLGLLFAVGTISLPRKVGIAIAIPSVLLCIPNMVLTTLVLNRDLLKLLTLEYDFWLFTILNSAYWCLLSSALGSTRWLVAFPGFINTQLIISIDANVRTLQLLLPGTIIWVPAAICFCVVCFIPVIDVDPSQFQSLLPSDRMIITRVNILTNICITLCLFTARRCYTKRSVLAKEFADTKLIPCALLRSKLQLSPTMANVSSQVQPNQTKQAVHMGCASTRIHPGRTLVTKATGAQLELVPRKTMTIDASQTLSALAMPHPSSPPLHVLRLVLLYLIGIAGLMLSVYATAFVPQESGNGLILSVLALVATIVFVSPFVLSYQRMMLRSLVTSFDVAFLSVEAVLAWLGFSIAIQWGPRSAAAFSVLLWVHFTLLVDALTPIIRARYRFRKAFLAPVVLLLVASTLGLVVNSASTYVDSVLPDRELLCTRVFSQNHCLHTASFVLQRLITLVIWTLRLLWVLCLTHDQELVFLRAGTRFASPVEVLPFRRNLPAELR